MLALKPELSLLVKLGSIVVHVEELLSPKGHPFDETAIRGLLSDPEVQEWLTKMDRMGFMPKPR